jgi:hypothetical protein
LLTFTTHLAFTSTLALIQTVIVAPCIEHASLQREKRKEREKDEREWEREG